MQVKAVVVVVAGADFARNKVALRSVDGHTYGNVLASRRPLLSLRQSIEAVVDIFQRSLRI